MAQAVRNAKNCALTLRGLEVVSIWGATFFRRVSLGVIGGKDCSGGTGVVRGFGGTGVS